MREPNTHSNVSVLIHTITQAPNVRLMIEMAILIIVTATSCGRTCENDPNTVCGDSCANSVYSVAPLSMYAYHIRSI